MGMAEGLLGGILGEEDEKLEGEASDALAGAEAFASAVVAKLAGNDPGVARKTEIFLDKQAQLLETQNEHLKDEHAARLHFLTGQAHEVDIRRFGLKLRVGFQLLIALLATGLSLGIAILVHDAITSRRVVIEPLRVPATLSARGFDGIITAGAAIQDTNAGSCPPRRLPGIRTRPMPC
jgi:hypothetical protein